MGQCKIRGLFIFTAAAFPSLLALSACARDYPLSARALQVEASSLTIEDGGDPARYHPVKAFDGDAATAWNEGAYGVGRDEWLSLTLDKPVTVDAVEILPGYYDAKWYAKNNRLKTARFLFDGLRVEAEFADGMDPKTVTLPRPATFTSFKLVIVDAYPGSVYRESCVSEIGFFIEKKRIAIDVSAPLRSAELGGAATGTSARSLSGRELRYVSSYMTEIYNTESFFYDHVYLARRKGHFYVDGQERVASGSGRVFAEYGTWRSVSADTIEVRLDYEVLVAGEEDTRPLLLRLRPAQWRFKVQPKIEEIERMKSEMPWSNASLRPLTAASAVFRYRLEQAAPHAGRAAEPGGVVVFSGRGLDTYEVDLGGTWRPPIKRVRREYFFPDGRYVLADDRRILYRKTGTWEIDPADGFLVKRLASECWLEPGGERIDVVIEGMHGNRTDSYFSRFDFTRRDLAEIERIEPGRLFEEYHALSPLTPADDAVRQCRETEEMIAYKKAQLEMYRAEEERTAARE